MQQNEDAAPAPASGASGVRFAVSSRRPGESASWSVSLRQVAAIVAAAIAVVGAIVLLERTPAGSSLIGQSQAIDVGAARQPLKPGEPAPDFALADVVGRTVRLSEQRGRTVVVNFWATWCPPCRAEMPEIDEVAREYAGRDVVVLAVNLQEERADVLGYVATLGVRFAPLLDPTGDVVRAYRVVGLPTTAIVDAAGVLREVHVGALNRPRLVEMIQRAMATARAG